jgi:hypothetical protein
MTCYSRARLLKCSLAPPGAMGSSADRQILTFELLVERVQAAFHADALRARQLRGEARRVAQVAGAEEQAHAQ